MEERGGAGRVRAHPELGVWPGQVGVVVLVVGEASHEGGSPAPAPLVMLHRAAQPQQPLRRVALRWLRCTTRRRRVLHWSRGGEIGGRARWGGRRVTCGEAEGVFEMWDGRTREGGRRETTRRGNC